MAGDSGERDGSGEAREGQEYAGATPAPVAGTYEMANLFGRRTGHRVTVQQNQMLPVVPREFSWVLIAADRR